MDTNDITSIGYRLRGAFRQDPKKASALGLLVVVLAIMWGRMLIGGGSSAKAAVTPPKSGTPATAVVTGRTPGNNPSVASRTSGPTAASTGAIGARSSDVDQRVRGWLKEPLRPVSRNLFTVKLEYFPSDGSRPLQGVKTARDGEFWGRLEKSLMLQADQRDKRENLLANYKAEAARLRLDSIMMGPQPKAMIDGKLVAEGDVVAAFRVLKIEARRIVVEREGIRLEIQMK